MRILSLLVLAFQLAALSPAGAQAIWDMATEYPQNTMPGLGLTTFADRIAHDSNGLIHIQLLFDGERGLRSATMLAAISEGRIQGGDAFSGALEAEGAIFALPSLPYLATTIADAHRLADLSRPALLQALAKKGQRLLYVVPWPPSGIWSKRPIKSKADLASLSIRTYDSTSSIVLTGTGAKAVVISYGDTMERLKDGSINAVLSSGDGGAGRKLWNYLPYFAVTTYSLPLSVASLSEAAYGALSPELRAAVDSAASETQAELWQALQGRLDDNYKHMRENGVTIDANPPAEVMETLKAAAVPVQQAWCAQAGPGLCKGILDPYLAGAK